MYNHVNERCRRKEGAIQHNYCVLFYQFSRHFVCSTTVLRQESQEEAGSMTYRYNTAIASILTCMYDLYTGI